MIDYLTQLKLSKDSANQLRIIDSKQKNLFLNNLVSLLSQNKDEILAENKKDLAEAVDLNTAMLKRLTLTEKIIEGMVSGLKEIINSEDPVGMIESTLARPNGMKVERMRVPIGVILFIYESRPNVIIDAAGLCIKSGNALIVRGGKEAKYSNAILENLIRQALKKSDLPINSVQQLENRDYDVLAEVVKMDKFLDLVVPRGREKLINYIKDNSRVPVIAHERGLCHMYIDESANKVMAIKLAVNAKVSNPSTCNSIEKILVHKNVAESIMPDLLLELIKNKVQIFGCERTCAYNKECQIANNEDWDMEYLDLKVAIKIVDSFADALEHIEKHSSHLTDSIITEDKEKAEQFVKAVNSASVLVNASNRLTDGGEFGLGAELGISTSSIHMRGPMGINDLTVTKYVVLGSGQIRE